MNQTAKNITPCVRALGDMSLFELLNWLADKDPDAILLEHEAAVVLRKTQRTLQMWRHDGIGPRFVACGGSVGYRLGAIRTFLRQAEVQSTAEAKVLRLERRGSRIRRPEQPPAS